MKTATTFFLVCVMSVIFANGAFAQSEGSKEERKQARHAKMVDRVVKKLDLDDGRAFEIRTILNESHAAKKALNEKRGEQAKALRQATKEKLEAVLTPQEFEQFKEIRKKAQKKMKNKMKNHKKDKNQNNETENNN